MDGNKSGDPNNTRMKKTPHGITAYAAVYAMLSCEIRPLPLGSENFNHRRDWVVERMWRQLLS